MTTVVVVGLVGVGVYSVLASGADAPQPRDEAALARARAEPADGPPRNGFVRDCASRAEPPTRPVDGEVAVGPLRFSPVIASSATEPASTFESRARQVGFRRYLDGQRGRRLPEGQRKRLRRLARSHHEALKIYVIVKAGARVTLAVPRAHRRHLGLLYDNESSSGRPVGPYFSYRVSDGDSAVRFEACGRDERPFGSRPPGGPYTAFPGGMVVAGPRCVPLEVRVEGRRRPLRRVFSFGAGRCRR